MEAELSRLSKLYVLSLDLCSVCAVFERYKSYSPYDMKESIRKEVKGDLEKSFLTLGNQHHMNHMRHLERTPPQSEFISPLQQSSFMKHLSCLHSGVL